METETKIVRRDGDIEVYYSLSFLLGGERERERELETKRQIDR